MNFSAQKLLRKLKNKRPAMIPGGQVKWIVGLVFAVLASSIVFIFLSKDVSAAWFNDNWAYRIKVTFGNTGSADANKKVKIDIDTAALIAAGKLQSDCGDSRFTDASGILLQYYIDAAGGACNTDSTDYYVLVPVIGVGTTTLYHYYGNPNAENGTNITQFSESAFSPASGPTSGSEEGGPGPIAYWKFDDMQGSVVQDSTGNNLDGTLGTGSSAPEWKTKDECFVNGCLDFDGSQDYVNVGDTPILEFGNADSEFSISSWVRLHDVPADSPATIISKYNSNGTHREWYFSVNDSLQPLIYMSEDGQNTNTHIETANTALAIGSWHHVAVTVNVSTDVHSLYIDGNEVATTDTGSAITTIDTGTAEVHIGAVASSSTTPDQFFPGQIDELKVYAYARSAEEIKQDYLSRGSVHGVSVQMGGSNMLSRLQEGLIGWWKMDENTGTSIADSSGDGTAGTLGTGSSAPTWSGGKYESGLDFDGTSDFVSISDNAVHDFEDGTEDFSMFAWVRRDTAETDDGILGKGDGSDDGYRLTYNATDQVRCGIDAITFDSTTTITDAGWHHVGCVIDRDGNGQIFIDGRPDGTPQAINAEAMDTTNDIVIGAERVVAGSASNPYDGAIDEVRIYNRVLTSDEVLGLYNWAPGPVVYHNFDEGVGTSTVIDSSGNSASGTLGGSVSSSNWVTGKYGKAYDFSSDFIESTDTISVEGKSQFTIAAWIYPHILDGTAKNIYLECIAGSCNTRVTFTISTDNQLILSARDDDSDGGTTNCVDDNRTLTANTWTHVAAVYDSQSGTHKIYLNGVPISLNPSGGCDNEFGSGVNSSEKPKIGASYDGTDAFFDGYIDDFKMYHYARTQAQIIEDMNGGHPIGGSPVGSPLSYWKLNDGSGDTAYDQIGTVNLSNNTSTWNPSGKFGGGWLGDGNDWLNTTTNAEENNYDLEAGDDFSMSMWFKSAVDSNPLDSQYIFLQGKADVSGGGAKGYIMYFNDLGQLVFGIDDDADWGTTAVPTPDDTAASTADVFDANWHHMVAVKTGTSKIELYIDGVLAGSDISLTATGDLTNSRAFVIGGHNTSNGNDEFLGWVDEIKIYRIALTPEQIAIDMNQGKTMTLGSQTTESAAGAGDANSLTQSVCPPGETGCSTTFLYWPMDENTGTTSTADASGLTAALTMEGSMTEQDWVRGKYGSALELDGSDDYLDLSNVATSVETSGTISMWIYPAPSSDVRTLFSYGGGNVVTPGKFEIQIDASDQISVLQNSNGTATENGVSTNGTITENEWNHIAVSSDGSVYTIYINGQIQALTTINAHDGDWLGDTTISSTRHATLGALYQDGGVSQFYPGIIDHAKYVTTPFTTSQIMWEYNRGAPVAWYKFDECQGTTVNDWGPAARGGFNGNDGTLTIGNTGGNDAPGTCNSGDSTEAWNNGTAGEINESIDFDGTDDYMQVSDTSSLRFDGATEDFSIFTWVKRNTSGAAHYILSKEDADNDGYRIQFDSGNTVTCSVDAIDITSTSTITDTGWHHIGCVIDRSGNGQVYIDGKANGTATAISSEVMATTSNIRFGTRSYTSTSYLDGQIDDVRIFNYALTSQQVKAIRNNGAVSFK